MDINPYVDLSQGVLPRQYDPYLVNRTLINDKKM